MASVSRLVINVTLSVKGKALPTQAYPDPEGSRRLRLPDLKKSVHESGKVVSLTQRSSLPLVSILALPVDLYEVVLEYKDIFFLTNAPYAFIFVG
jgi:hypothetical protein